MQQALIRVFERITRLDEEKVDVKHSDSNSGPNSNDGGGSEIKNLVAYRWLGVCNLCKMLYFHNQQNSGNYFPNKGTHHHVYHFSQKYTRRCRVINGCYKAGF